MALTWFWWWVELTCFSSGVEINYFFVWGIEFDLVLVLESKVTCFLCRDRNWPCAGRNYFFWSVIIDWLGFCIGGGRNWPDFWMRAANRLVLGWASKLAWVLSGWSILTWIQCGGSSLIWFQFRDRNWFLWCMGVENDLVLVCGSKLTWILCDDGRPQTDMESWQIDVFVMF